MDVHIWPVEVCVWVPCLRSLSCEIELGGAEDAAQVLFSFEMLLDSGPSCGGGMI